MHNMCTKDFEDEDEDEWFYDSIKRYRQLRMFDVENVLKQIELSDMRSICVVGEHRSGRHEILEFLLPDKITVAACQEGLVKNSDLKMKSGVYTPAPVTQMKTLWNEKKIIMGMEEEAGVSLYSLGSENSDLISRIATLNCDMVSPNMALNNKGLVLLTAKGKCDVIVMDICENTTVHKKSISTNDTQVWLDPSFVSKNLTAVCNRYNGNVTLQDLREDETCTTISQGVGGQMEELWTIGTEENKMNSTGDNFNLGLVSSLGKLVIYDVRNIQKPMHSYNIGINTCVTPRLNFSPENSKIVSVSGFDDKVYVFDVSHAQYLSTVFVHDGHKHHNGSVGDNFVTCHMWYRDNIVISASSNSSLHCWQFIPQTT